MGKYRKLADLVLGLRERVYQLERREMRPGVAMNLDHVLIRTADWETLCLRVARVEDRIAAEVGQLRKERVELQGENESLRHDIKELHRLDDDGAPPVIAPSSAGKYLSKVVIGDRVQLKNAVSVRGHEIADGWYPVVGLDGPQIQIKFESSGGLAWLWRGFVEEIDHANVG